MLSTDKVNIHITEVRGKNIMQSANETFVHPHFYSTSHHEVLVTCDKICNYINLYKRNKSVLISNLLNTQ